MKPILILLLIIPISVFATDRKPPERPPVTREVHTQSVGGDNAEKYLLGAAIGIAACYFFDLKPCRKDPEPIFKTIKSEPKP